MSLTEHEYDFVMEALSATASTGADQKYIEEVQEKIAAMDKLKTVGINAMQNGKSFRSSMELHLKMKQMKKDETIALIDPKGVRIFRLEEITSHSAPNGRPKQINEKIFDELSSQN